MFVLSTQNHRTVGESVQDNSSKVRQTTAIRSAEGQHGFAEDCEKVEKVALSYLFADVIDNVIVISSATVMLVAQATHTCKKT